MESIESAKNAHLKGKFVKQINEDGSLTVGMPYIGKSLTIQKSDYPESVNNYFWHFGAGTKYRNFTAMENDENGKPISDDEKWARVLAGHKALLVGDIRIASTREAGSGPKAISLENQAWAVYFSKALTAKGFDASVVDAEYIQAKLDAAKEAKMSDGKSKYDAAKASPAFKAALEQVKLANQIAKAKAAAEKAGQSGEDELDALI